VPPRIVSVTRGGRSEHSRPVPYPSADAAVWQQAKAADSAHFCRVDRHEGLSPECRVPSAECSALADRTIADSPSTQHSLLGTRHSALGTRHSALRIPGLALRKRLMRSSVGALRPGLAGKRGRDASNPDGWPFGGPGRHAGLPLSLPPPTSLAAAHERRHGGADRRACPPTTGDARAHDRFRVARAARHSVPAIPLLHSAGRAANENTRRRRGVRGGRDERPTTVE